MHQHFILQATTVNLFDWILANGGELSGWLALAYIIATKTLPKIAPAYFKAKYAREDRLFNLLESTNKQNAKLTSAIDGLSSTLATFETRIEHRLEAVENKLRDCDE